MVGLSCCVLERSFLMLGSLIAPGPGWSCRFRKSRWTTPRTTTITWRASKSNGSTPGEISSRRVLRSLRPIAAMQAAWKRLRPRHGIHSPRSCETLSRMTCTFASIGMILARYPSPIVASLLMRFCRTALFLKRNRQLRGVLVQTGNSWMSERSGLAAKCCFHSRGVRSATRLAGCSPTRCRTSTR